MRFQERTVLVIHNRNRCACRAVRCDGRERENRLVVRDAETFYGIKRFSAAYAENHIGKLIQFHSPQTLDRLIRAVFSENLFSNDDKIRLIHRCFDFIIGSGKRFLSSNYKNGLSIRLTYRADLVVNSLSDGIVWQMNFIIFQFHVLFSLLLPADPKKHTS